MHCEMCENRMVLRAHGRARRVCGCRPLHVGLCLPFAAAATLLLAWQQETFFRANSEIGWGAPSTSFQNAVRFLPKEEPAAEPQAPEPEAADPAPQLDTEETQDRIAKPAEVDDEEEEEEAEATSVEVKAPILPKKHQMPQPKTLLGVYEELCRMGIQSPGGIRNAGAEVRDAVVKLYQNLVERPPPAPFHRERMVHLASPNCRDPMWRHLLDGSRRKTPRIVVDVTTGMGGGPELDLLEMRLWEINASLSHLDGSPPVKALHRRFRCVRMAEQQDWLGKFDNATSFLYTAHNANGTPTRRLGYENSDGPLPVERTARHLLTMCDLSREEVMNILRVATAMKESRRTFMDTGFDRFSEILKGCSLLTLFEKPSLRTRVSLEVGMNQMGGQAIFYSIADSPLGAKESIQDTGRVLSRMCRDLKDRSMPECDSKTSGCVDDDPHTLRFYLKRIVLAIAAGQGAVALFRYAVGDFSGALTDALICFIGFLCIYEFEALYVLFYCLSCCLGCCLSLGVALLMWLQKDLVRSQRLDIICADPFLLQDLGLVCQGITARVTSRKGLRSLAQVSSIPVINALDDYAHPMQMCADLLTIFEHKGSINGLTMAYMGDLENNVTYDLMRTAALMGYNLNLACPSASGLSNVSKVWTEVNALTEKSGSKVTVFPTAKEAISGVDVVYCDSWMSYGIPKDEEEARKKLFMPFQVTTELMKLAKPDAIFMNCLPAARGMEQTAEVIDGPQSVVFDQAENRLHAQKALLVFLIAPKRFMETLGAPLHPGRP
eukprot:s1385_g43.t1